MSALPSLPIAAALPELTDALTRARQVVLEAPPGAGKSTVVPLALLEAGWLGHGRILMLEPRRLAARAIAERMADSLGEPVGRRVGYRTRLESRVGSDTRIEVLTEGILTRMLQRDPALDGVACVVFDEFHERNLQGDLGLALTLESQRHLRPDLRLLVMSATLDADALAHVLEDARFVRAPGRMHEVATFHAPPVTVPAPPLARVVAQRIVQSLEAHPGDLLAFLPGAGEIRRVTGALAALLADEQCVVLPLYGELATDAQDAALQPDPRGRRKVVVATNIAETSLTIDGVRIVVDAGLERRQRFDPATGMSRLETLRISQASAEQRRGRAGRTAPGVCYRLWSESTHAALLPHAPPEILEADLAPLALELACWGTVDATALSWLDPPPAATLAQARDLLVELEALDAEGRVTRLGREMGALGVHPRLAHMMLRARELGLGRLGCELAAVLSERDPLRSDAPPADPDVRLRLDALHGHALPPGTAADRAALRRIERVARQLERQLDRASARQRSKAIATAPPDGTGLLLAYAYPDRIGRARGVAGGRYLLSGGRGAALAGPTALARSEYLVAAMLDAGEREARVQLAAPITLDLLHEHFPQRFHIEERVEWDPRSAAVAARRLRTLGQVIVEESPLHGANPRITATMLEGIRSMGIGCLPWTTDLEQWRARVAFARAHDSRGQGGWPDVGDDALLGTLEQWLAPWLEGITRREQLARLDLRHALHGLLEWDARRRLDAFAPTHLTVPSGSRIPVDYTTGVPTLAVRLQEVFGLEASPAVADGRVPVTLELLSPARRPVQITRDLASFWTRGYPEVRRELKGRYPKHYWPENPREAVATRRVRPPGT